MKKIAQLLSFIFSPITFLFITPYVVVHSQIPSRLYAIKWALFSGIFIATGVFFIIFGRVFGMFSDFDISRREERIRIYIVAWILVVLYWLCALFFKGIFFPISIIAFGLLVGIFLFTVINRFIKASIHTGLACAFIITASILWKGDNYLKVIWILPLIAWSRIYLKKHTIKEVIAGGILGSVLTFITFLLAKFLYNI